MYVDVRNRSKIFRNLKYVEGLMPDYDGQTNLSKLVCIVNLCKNLGDMLEIISV